MSDCEGENASARKVVKTFSWKACADEPDDDLTKSLVKVEFAKQHHKKEGTSSEQWLQMFDGAIEKALHRDDAILVRPTKDLALAYKKLLKYLPKEHEARVEDGPPRLDVVVEAVSLAQSRWRKSRKDTKTGHTKDLFTKVVKYLHGHRDLFAIVPSSDKYVSLVAGSMSVIIKATMNHEGITESISDALDEVSDDIAYWNEMLKAKGDYIRIENYISRLYTGVFEFFTTIMIKWSSKGSIGRSFRSFDAGFLQDEIEKKRHKIRDLNDKLRRQSDIAMHHKTECLVQWSQLQTEAQAKFEVQLTNVLVSQKELHLGMTSMTGLFEECRSYILKAQSLAEASMTSRRLLNCDKDQLMPSTCYTAFEIQSCVLDRLESYAVPQDISPLIENAKFLSIHIEICIRLKHWNESPSPQLLWVQGPFGETRPSRYTLLSSYVIMTAQKAESPVLYYFCNSEMNVIDLVYSLMAQLIKILPGDRRSEKGVSVGRFDSLDQTVDSVDLALDLLSDLLTIGPPLLFIVIDGLQILEKSDSDVRQLQKLLKIVRHTFKEDSEQDCLVKTLFTTDGFPETLTETDVDERINAVEIGEVSGGPHVDEMEIGFYL
ncbi:MAG: hypothetical protein Q9167_007806 [Letrouitia subvulpina]